MIDLNKQLQRWLEDGIITSEQAKAMRDSVVGSRPSDIAGERRIPIVTEILGYVGAALAIWAVVFLVSEFWGNLSDWAQASLFGAVALVLFAAGASLLDADEPALARLSGVLWAGSVGALAGALRLTLDLTLDMSAEAIWTLAGLGAAIVGGLMLRRNPSIAQQVVLFAAVITTVMSLLSVGDNPAVFVYGFVTWGIGLVWVLVARAGVLRPRSTGTIVGALTMLVGAQVSAAEGDAVTFGVLLGLATAGLFATAGIAMRERLAVILGGLGIFWFVPQAMFHFFGETFGAMFGLFISGLAIVGLALWFSKHKEAL